MTSTFDKILNSCGSMTKELESFGKKLEVSLISEQHNAELTDRLITLNIDNQAIILAYSYCKSTDKIFYDILKNANTTPIGKYLFSGEYKIIRSDFQVNKQSYQQINIKLQPYLNNQQHWVRESVFSYQQQQLFLIEVILPNAQQIIKDIEN